MSFMVIIGSEPVVIIKNKKKTMSSWANKKV